MQIGIFGATGRTGQLLTQKALGRHYAVRAFARRPSLLEGAAGQLTIHVGEGVESDAVVETVDGAEAVVVAVSGRRGDPHGVSRLTQAVITAATTTSRPRLVVVGSYGMVATKPPLVASIVRRAFREAFADQALAEEALRTSLLDWMVIRPTRLTDGPSKGSRRTTLPLSKGPFTTSRADLADAILDVVEDPTVNHSFLNVSN